MIEQTTGYKLRCDGCGKYLDASSDYAIYDEPENAEQEAKLEGWTPDDQEINWYCESCSLPSVLEKLKNKYNNGK